VDTPVYSPRKLIEVALPLDSINTASKEEKAVPRRGHPQTLHYWWARRPLAAARAVLFAQLVNDPGYQQGGGFKYGKNKKEAAIERKRLFKILEELIKWENTNNVEVINAAQAEINRSWQEICALNKDHPNSKILFNPQKLPSIHDPFSGGGTIPLEAVRLGLHSYASDLNPVAVFISKAMIEVPFRFANHVPVGPEFRDEEKDQTKLDVKRIWPGLSGLAEDVRRYGNWMQNEALKRIGNLYPTIEITKDMAHDRADLVGLVGENLTVVAWLWARTVKSPNPAFSDIEVPLTTTFMLSDKVGKNVYIEPKIGSKNYELKVRVGVPPLSAKEGTKAKGQGATFNCIMSDTPISGDYIKAEAQSGRMGAKLMALVAESPQGRVYLEGNILHEQTAVDVKVEWKPDIEFFQQALGFRVGAYGMSKWSDLFSSRQLVALKTISDLIEEVRQKILGDLKSNQHGDIEEGTDLASGGDGPKAYAQAISVYLGCALSRLASYNNTICLWNMRGGSVAQTFARQSISMTWDHIEVNPFQKMSGNWSGGIEWVSAVIDKLPHAVQGTALQLNSTSLPDEQEKVIFSTDPPYYDNIGYADLSDLFYVWMRPTFKSVFPELFATRTVPKAEELVATPLRHGGRKNAESFFLEGMTKTMERLSALAHPAFPVTIYYAFKQSEKDGDEGTASTGWETFLDAVLKAGFTIDGTWPMRTEREGGIRNEKRNSLASSIVLVCRKRSVDAPSISRREFLRDLNAVLPDALDEMTKGSGDDRSPVAPVDLSQAIIGPGMAVFSKYSAVLEADGTPMKVRTALQLINRFLAEDDFDRDTQFCLHWFEQQGWTDGKFGDADILARAKGTSVSGVKEAGVIQSGGGIVRLLKWSEYAVDWDPKTDTRNPVWESLHHLIRALKQHGETNAGFMLSAIKRQSESVRQLAYRLYTLCERQGWAEDARAYNELITSWSSIELASNANPIDKQLSILE
jgi:putative DNA methylase